MQVEQLPATARERLEILLNETLRILNAAPSPHRRAVSDSAMKDGVARDAALWGGMLRAPVKPPFRYQKYAYSLLHRAVFEAAGGSLYSLVVHGERPEVEAPWTCHVKLVGRAEHDSLDAARRPIDAAVERALRGISVPADWEWVSFGRDRVNKEPEVTRRSEVAGLDRPEPEPQLRDLLHQAEALYRQRGLDLLIATWTLRPAGFEFHEHYE